MAPSEMAIRARLRKYKTIFHKAHAIIPERAIRPEDFGITRGRIFNRLLRQKIIVSVGNDKFFYDVLREKYLIKRSSLTVIIVLAVMVLIVFIFFLSRTPK
jgi:hypothetical protein